MVHHTSKRKRLKNEVDHANDNGAFLDCGMCNLRDDTLPKRRSSRFCCVLCRHAAGHWGILMWPLKETMLIA